MISYWPTPTPSQANSKGACVSFLTNSPLAKNSTLAKAPSAALSEAVAAKVMVAGDTNSVPSTGEVNSIVGAWLIVKTKSSVVTLS